MLRAWRLKNRVETPLLVTATATRPSSSEACRPDFLCIGAQKAGTTWLYRQLRVHPDFWMPPRKEIRYFDKLGRRRSDSLPRTADERDSRFFETMESLSAQSFFDLEGYGQLFESKGSLISGDISPGYSALNDEIIVQIVRHFPRLKVIFVARDPVERAWSQLLMGVRLQRTNPFDISDADEVIRRLLHPGVLLYSYPSRIIARWRRYVPPNQFQIYFFDELQKSPALFFGSIVRFLGGDPEKASSTPEIMKKVNSEQELQFSEKVRSRMVGFFESELKACAKQFGGPARQWPGRYGLSLLLLFFSTFDNFLDIIVGFDWMM